MTALATTPGTGDSGLNRELLVLGAVVVLGTIMSILDVTIVNVAIPTLGSDFHTSISTIQWVLTGYLLAFASVIPMTGWATERFGAKGGSGSLRWCSSCSGRRSPASPGRSDRWSAFAPCRGSAAG